MAVRKTPRIHVSEAESTRFPEYLFCPLLGPDKGTLAGCTCGILEYSQTEFRQGGIHEDQEVFYVLEGRGEALVGEESFPLRPGDCFHVTPGLWHYIKRDKDSAPIRLFFFHAAV